MVRHSAISYDSFDGQDIVAKQNLLINSTYRRKNELQSRVLELNDRRLKIQTFAYRPQRAAFE
jgi:hypothetical protein